MRRWRILSNAMQSLSASGWSIGSGGPTPPSNEMRGYEDACPGAADRIISLAEREANHRHQMDRGEADHSHQMDKDRLSLQGKLASRGQLIVGAVFLVMVAGGALLIHAGDSVSGLILVLTPFAGVLAKLLWPVEHDAESKKTPKKPEKKSKKRKAAGGEPEAAEAE